MVQAAIGGKETDSIGNGRTSGSSFARSPSEMVSQRLDDSLTMGHMTYST